MKWQLSNFLDNIYLAAPIIFFSSLVFGIAFYMIVNQWEFRLAYYFASTVLLGNMYLIPTEPNLYSQMFTEFYFLWGTTMIAGAIAATVNGIVSNASRIAAEERHKMISVLEHDNVTEDYEDSCISEKEKKPTKLKLRLTKETNALDRGLYAVYRMYHKFLRKFGITSSQYLSVRYLLFVVWIIVGAIYGVTYEGWSIGYSFFFALSAMSGSGACPPDCINDPPVTDLALCDIGVVRAYFFGTYILFGVPIFTYTAGQFAEILVKKAVQLNERKLMLRPLNVQEFQYALDIQKGNIPHSLYSHDDCSVDDVNYSVKSRSRRNSSFAFAPSTTGGGGGIVGPDGNIHIEFDGFIILELLRLKKITKHDLEYMKILFDNLKNPYTDMITLCAPTGVLGGGGLGGGNNGRRMSVSRTASLAATAAAADHHNNCMLDELQDSNITPIMNPNNNINSNTGGYDLKEAAEHGYNYTAPMTGLHTIYEEPAEGGGGGGNNANNNYLGSHTGSLTNLGDSFVDENTVLLPLTTEGMQQHQQQLLQRKLQKQQKQQAQQQEQHQHEQEQEQTVADVSRESNDDNEGRKMASLSSSLEQIKLWRYQDTLMDHTNNNNNDTNNTNEIDAEVRITADNTRGIIPAIATAIVTPTSLSPFSNKQSTFQLDHLSTKSNAGSWNTSFVNNNNTNTSTSSSSIKQFRNNRKDNVNPSEQQQDVENEFATLGMERVEDEEGDDEDGDNDDNDDEEQEEEQEQEEVSNKEGMSKRLLMKQRGKAGKYTSSASRSRKKASSSISRKKPINNSNQMMIMRSPSSSSYRNNNNNNNLNASSSLRLFPAYSPRHRAQQQQQQQQSLLQHGFSSSFHSPINTASTVPPLRVASPAATAAAVPHYDTSPKESHKNFPFLRSLFGYSNGDHEHDANDGEGDGEVLGIYNQLIIPMLHSIQQKNDELHHHQQQHPSEVSLQLLDEEERNINHDYEPLEDEDCSIRGGGRERRRRGRERERGSDQEEDVEAGINEENNEHYHYGYGYGYGYGSVMNNNTTRGTTSSSRNNATAATEDDESTPLIVLPHRNNRTVDLHLQQLYQHGQPS